MVTGAGGGWSQEQSPTLGVGLLHALDREEGNMELSR